VSVEEGNPGIARDLGVSGFRICPVGVQLSVLELDTLVTRSASTDAGGFNIELSAVALLRTRHSTLSTAGSRIRAQGTPILDRVA